MARLVVDLFEVIEVEQNHGERVAGAFGARDFFLAVQFAETGFVEAGKRIENRGIRKVCRP